MANTMKMEHRQVAIHTTGYTPIRHIVSKLSDSVTRLNNTLYNFEIMSVTIVQRPVQNAVYAKNAVPKIILDSTDIVNVTLLFKNPDDEEWELSNTVFNGSYAPDFFGYINIDFNGLFDTYVKTNMPIAGWEYPQSDYLYEFRAWIVGVASNTQYTITWKVANAKLKPSLDFEDWSQSHFLTNQPKEKNTTKESLELLSYYDDSGTLAVKARVYPTSGGHTDLTLTSANTGVTTVNVSCAAINHIVGAASELNGWYDIMLMSRDTVLATQRYIVRKLTGSERYYLFVNALGGIDTLICRGDNTLQPEATFNTGIVGNRRVALDDTDDMRFWQQNIRFKWRLRNWIHELLTGKKEVAIYDPTTGSTSEIVITDMELNVGNRETLASASFKYMLADTDDTAADDNGTLKLSSLLNAETIIIEEEEVSEEKGGENQENDEEEP